MEESFKIEVSGKELEVRVFVADGDRLDAEYKIFEGEDCIATVYPVVDLDVAMKWQGNDQAEAYGEAIERHYL